MYHRSPARIKTLDILGRATSFEDQSHAQLTKFCIFAREESGAKTPLEGAQFLSDRYDWNIDCDSEEFANAWVASKKSLKPLENLDDSDNIVSQSSQSKDIPSRINIVLKKDAFAKSMLLCQVHDSSLHFIGDSGAIGRLTTDSSDNGIILDLKGRQYRGKLYAGPTVFFMNTSQLSGKSALSGQATAKVESVANEFCHLNFEKDNMLDLVGLYSGDMSYVRGEKYGEEGEKDDTDGSKSKSKKRKQGDDSDDESDDNDEYSEEEEVGKKKKSKIVTEKKKKQSQNPKISTITSRAKSKDAKKRKKSTKK